MSKRLLTVSDRLYRILLLSYPSEFRRAYRYEMAQTFRTCCREALQKQGAWGVTRLWGFVLYDLVTTACIEHSKALLSHLKHFFMNKLASQQSVMMITGREHTIMMSKYRLNVAQQTDIGRQREVNEDHVGYVVPEDTQILARKGALFIVTDGLGGHTAGERASEIALKAASDAYYQSEDDDVAVALRHAIEHANATIYQMATENAQWKGMGTTCVAAVLQGEMAYVANVGDSRAYLVRDNQMKQISLDHSLVGRLVRDGEITEDEARVHPERNMIYRCLGEKSDVEVDIFSEKVQESDLLLLCTDGLTGLVSNEELCSIVHQYEPQESVRHLIERANENGGPDNITALVVRVAPEN
jgi:PPM family protein phosphatase